MDNIIKYIKEQSAERFHERFNPTSMTINWGDQRITQIHTRYGLIFLTTFRIIDGKYRHVGNTYYRQGNFPQWFNSALEKIEGE